MYWYATANKQEYKQCYLYGYEDCWHVEQQQQNITVY